MLALYSAQMSPNLQRKVLSVRGLNQQRARDERPSEHSTPSVGVDVEHDFLDDDDRAHFEGEGHLSDDYDDESGLVAELGVRLREKGREKWVFRDWSGPKKKGREDEPSLD